MPEVAEADTKTAPLARDQVLDYFRTVIDLHVTECVKNNVKSCVWGDHEPADAVFVHPLNITRDEFSILIGQYEYSPTRNEMFPVGAWNLWFGYDLLSAKDESKTTKPAKTSGIMTGRAAAFWLSELIEKYAAHPVMVALNAKMGLEKIETRPASSKSVAVTLNRGSSTEYGALRIYE